MLLLTLVPAALACDAFGLHDVERGVDVKMNPSSAYVGAARGEPTYRVFERSRTDRTATIEAEPARGPIGVLYEWGVDAGDRLMASGSEVAREGRPVAEWVGTDTLVLAGGQRYAVALEPAPPRKFPSLPDGQWDVLRHDRNFALEVTDPAGSPVLTGVARSLCSATLHWDDVQREIRTRAALYLVVTRVPEGAALEPSIARDLPMGRSPIGPAPLQIRASSSLVEQGRTYGPEHLTDRDPATAWCEGASTNGIGETLTVALDRPMDPVLTVVPGYTKSARSLVDNGQPRLLLVRTDGGLLREIALPWRERPSDEAFEIALDAPGTTSFTVELVEAWPGARWDDTCISEIGVRDGR